MTRVMAVQFASHGQLHYLDPGSESYRVGESVLFPTDNGPEVCRVVWAPESWDADGFDDLPVVPGTAPGPTTCAARNATPGSGPRRWPSPETWSPGTGWR